MKHFLRNNIYYILFCLGCLSALGTAPVYAWPITVMGYASLVYALKRTDVHHWKHAALKSFVFFFGFFLASLYWISNSLFVDIAQWWWALPFSFAGLPFLLALFPAIIIGILFILIKKINHTNIRAILIIFAFIAADYARGIMFTGFPWNIPAHIWIKTDIMMTTLPYIGFYGLNTLTLVLFGLFALLSIRFKAVYGIIFITLAIIPIHKNDDANVPDNIVMIQANIPQNEKWNPDYIDRNFNRYLDMSRAAILNNEPQIIIWPETAISQNLLSYPDKNQSFKTFLDGLPPQSVLITGFLTYDSNDFYNSMAIFDRTGEIIAMYDKRHLVPFGEYMPFGLDTVTGFNNFQSGSQSTPIQINDMNITIVPLICYEIIFPQYSKYASSESFILNITNDSWFGNTAGPYQHFDHAIFRAVENKVPVIRLSGNGLSGIINRNGHIFKISGLNEIATINTHK